MVIRIDDLYKKRYQSTSRVPSYFSRNVYITVAKTEPAENIKPDKAKSKERIDGVVALIMALDRIIRNEGKGKSVYEERGIRIL